MHTAAAKRLAEAIIIEKKAREALERSKTQFHATYQAALNDWRIAKREVKAAEKYLVSITKIEEPRLKREHHWMQVLTESQQRNLPKRK